MYIQPTLQREHYGAALRKLNAQKSHLTSILASQHNKRKRFKSLENPITVAAFQTPDSVVNQAPKRGLISVCQNIICHTVTDQVMEVT